ncbi:MAG TPA: hypothetical protein VFL93_01830 [Longimicrobiaceae bacterium]|nr:hypothetical protein [Longimicrobiaceae bacterium]
MSDSITAAAQREGGCTLGVGDRLPPLSLPDAESGRPSELIQGRGPLVLLLDPEGCADCIALLRQIAERPAVVTDWGGRVVAVVPGSDGGPSLPAAGESFPLQVLRDPEGRLGERCGVGGSALLISDEWGEIYFAQTPDAEHPLPTAEEVGEWLRFVAIQCPECEAPEGEWRTL